MTSLWETKKELSFLIASEEVWSMWCFWVKAYDLLFRDWWIARENVILSDSCQFVAVIYIFRTISILSRIHSCIVFFFLSCLAWSELSICTYAEANKLENAGLYILECLYTKRDNFVTKCNNFVLKTSFELFLVSAISCLFGVSYILCFFLCLEQSSSVWAAGS